MKRAVLPWLAALALGLTCGSTFAVRPLQVVEVKHDAPVDFEREIYPILKANCISCHNKTTSKADLMLESPQLMLKGGENGPAIVPGKGAESLLFKTAAHIEEPPMPPHSNKVSAVELKPQELGLLKLWIDQGAKGTAHREREIVWEPLPQAFRAIYSVALSRDGRYAACSRAGQIFVYDLARQGMVTRLTDDSLVKSGLYKNPGVAHRDLVPSLAFSPDGKQLASGSYREVKLWALEELRPTKTQPADATRASQIVALSNKPIIANGRSAVLEKDGRVRIKDTKSGVSLATLKGDPAANDRAAERARFATFLGEETAYHKDCLKDAEDDKGKLLDRVKKVNEGIKTADAAIAPKGKAVTDAGKLEADAQKAAKGFDAGLAAGPPVADNAKKIKEADEKLADATKKVIDARNDVVRAQEHAAHERVVLKLANDAVQKQTRAIEQAKNEIASAEKAQQQAEKEKQSAVDLAAKTQVAIRAMELSTDGGMLATATDDGLIRLWNTTTGAPAGTLRAPNEPVEAALALQWGAPNADTAGELSATWKDGSMVSWTIGSHWTWQRTLGGDAKAPMHDRVNALCYAPDGKVLAAGSGEVSRGGEVTLWDPVTGKLIRALPELHKDSVLALDFSPDGKLLATGSADKSSKVIETATGKIVKTFEGHSSQVLGVGWRHEGRTLASAGADNAVKVWDFISGDRKKSIDTWDAEVTTLKYVGYTGNMLTASGDKRVRLLSDTGAEIRNFPGSNDFVQSAAVSEDGAVVIAGGPDGVLRVWDGNTGKLTTQFSAP